MLEVQGVDQPSVDCEAETLQNRHVEYDSVVEDLSDVLESKDPVKPAHNV